MPSLHLAYDEPTTTVRCLKSHFRAIYVQRSHDIVRFHGHPGVVVASTILFNSELYKKNKKRKIVARRHVVGTSHDARTRPARGSHGGLTAIVLRTQDLRWSFEMKISHDDRKV